MKINKDLNLVLTVEREDGDAIHVFHTPILRETFEKYYRVISKVMTAIYAEQMSFFSGPSICSLLLKETAENTLRPNGDDTWWDGEDGVENGLVEEIRRLTNVLVLGPSGWDVIPYSVALKRDIFTQDEMGEVEGSLAFFTFSSRMKMHPVASKGLSAAATMFGWQLTSLTLMEYKTSLMMSIEDEISGESETVVALSIPS
jgi:hypothetical protein